MPRALSRQIRRIKQQDSNYYTNRAIILLALNMSFKANRLTICDLIAIIGLL